MRIEINNHHHFDNPETLALLRSLRLEIETMSLLMAQKITDLESKVHVLSVEVKANTDAIAGAVAVISQLRDGTDDPTMLAALDQIGEELVVDTTALQAAKASLQVADGETPTTNPDGS